MLKASQINSIFYYDVRAVIQKQIKSLTTNVIIAQKR